MTNRVKRTIITYPHKRFTRPPQSPFPLSTKFSGTTLPLDTREVKVFDGTCWQDLPMRQDLEDRSNGYGWGYYGAGPAQLALAMCAWLLGDRIAFATYKHVKENLTCALPANWELSAVDVATVARTAPNWPRAPIPKNLSTCFNCPHAYGNRAAVNVCPETHCDHPKTADFSSHSWRTVVRDW